LRNAASTNKMFYTHVDIIHGAVLAGDDYSGSWDW